MITCTWKYYNVYLTKKLLFLFQNLHWKHELSDDLPTHFWCFLKKKVSMHLKSSLGKFGSPYPTCFDSLGSLFQLTHIEGSYMFFHSICFFFSVKAKNKLFGHMCLTLKFWMSWIEELPSLNFLCWFCTRIWLCVDLLNEEIVRFFLDCVGQWWWACDILCLCAQGSGWIPTGGRWIWVKNVLK